jgi:hypothetical protein
MSKLTIIDDSVWELDDKAVDSHFESGTRQMFEQDDKCYVYYKDDKLLYTITTESYIRLLLKLNRIESVLVPLHLHEKLNKLKN